MHVINDHSRKLFTGSRLCQFAVTISSSTSEWMFEFRKMCPCCPPTHGSTEEGSKKPLNLTRQPTWRECSRISQRTTPVFKLLGCVSELFRIRECLWTHWKCLQCVPEFFVAKVQNQLIFMSENLQTYVYHSGPAVLMEKYDRNLQEANDIAGFVTADSLLVSIFSHFVLAAVSL